MINYVFNVCDNFEYIFLQFYAKILILGTSETIFRGKDTCRMIPRSPTTLQGYIRL